jgi:hypothetical protein
MKFKGSGRYGSGPRRPSIQNILWIMRQIESLDPFSKEILNKFILNGEVPSDWKHIIRYAHGKHFLENATEEKNKHFAGLIEDKY